MADEILEQPVTEAEEHIEDDAAGMQADEDFEEEDVEGEEDTEEEDTEEEDLGEDLEPLEETDPAEPAA